MSRTPNSRGKRRTSIVDVAARAIHRDGYAGVRMADVMKEAGLTTAASMHFDSRDAFWSRRWRVRGGRAQPLRPGGGEKAGKGISAFRRS
jgi:AcrR family transcriptional regulator